MYLFRRLSRLRQEYEVLQTDRFTSFWAGADVYGFKRAGESEEIVILINRHPSQQREVVLDFSHFFQKPFAKHPAQENSSPGSLVLDLLTG